MSDDKQARLIAYYLPQFHPIPENDLHWGKGFTEWTNVAKAKALFKGHYQPLLPTELGYYDLRLAHARLAQANLAREHGIEGFCYWHYWFAGKRLLETPFNEVLKLKEPDFPFSLCWANHSWTAVWSGNSKRIIMEQTYPGNQDFIDHFYELLPAFLDSRYITIAGKLLFSIFSPRLIPDCKGFIDTWQNLAIKEGLTGFHFVGMGVHRDELPVLGLDAHTPHTPHPIIDNSIINWKDKIAYRLFKKNFADSRAHIFKLARVYKYADFVEATKKQTLGVDEYPVALPNWDHSPRSGKKGFILHNSTPQLFGDLLEHCVNQIAGRPFEKRIVFLKAWNEWAEGNYLEPDAKFGRGYLEIVKKIVLG